MKDSLSINSLIDGLRQRFEKAKETFLEVLHQSEENQVLYEPQAVAPSKKRPMAALLFQSETQETTFLRQGHNALLLNQKEKRLVASEEGDLHFIVERESLKFNEKIFYSNDLLQLGETSYLVKVIPEEYLS